MADEAQPLPNVGARVLLRGVAALVLGVVVAGLAHRALTRARDFYWDESYATAHEGFVALRGALETPRPLGLVLGVSGAARLNPLVMDPILISHGVDIETYNFALPGISMDSLAAMAERLTHELDALHRRTALTIFEVPLLMMTERAVQNAAGERVMYIEVHDARTLVALAKRAPLAALDVVYRRWLLGNAYVGDAANWLLDRVVDRDWACRGPFPLDAPLEDRKQIEVGCLAIANSSPGGLAPFWDPTARGFLRIPTEAEAAWLVSNPPPSAARIDRHIANLGARRDALELHFDPQAIDQYEAAARALAAVSDHLVLVLLPTHPALQRSRASESRVDALLARLRRIAPVADLRRDPSVGADDFADSVHINPLAAHSDKLARLTATGVAHALGR